MWTCELIKLALFSFSINHIWEGVSWARRLTCLGECVYLQIKKIHLSIIKPPNYRLVVCLFSINRWIVYFVCDFDCKNEKCKQNRFCNWLVNKHLIFCWHFTPSYSFEYNLLFIFNFILIWIKIYSVNCWRCF